MSTVKIIPTVLTAQVAEGKKKLELQELYGLNASQMGAALKALGLTIKKTRKEPAFEFVVENTKDMSGTDVTNAVVEEDNIPTTEGIVEDLNVTDAVEVNSNTEAEVEVDVTAETTWE